VISLSGQHLASSLLMGVDPMADDHGSPSKYTPADSLEIGGGGENMIIQDIHMMRTEIICKKHDSFFCFFCLIDLSCLVMFCFPPFTHGFLATYVILIFSISVGFVLMVAMLLSSYFISPSFPGYCHSLSSLLFVYLCLISFI
jgi:hypothetical protein